MSKFTPWFPPHVKPIHFGVYRTQLINQCGEKLLTGYSLWNGDYWMDTRSSVNSARVVHAEGTQNKRWRGLKEAV